MTMYTGHIPKCRRMEQELKAKSGISTHSGTSFWQELNIFLIGHPTVLRNTEQVTDGCDCTSVLVILEALCHV